ncbi:MAG: S8 family serine peptidase [Dehalococcoidia bacterium]|nr:S8 family serine peptidase [Dehalococcoidia bacterium]
MAGHPGDAVPRDRGGCDIASFSLRRGRAADGKSLLSVGAERMAKLGVIVVGSAGNSGPRESNITAPGDAPLVITVGAVDKQLGLAQFSSRGGTSDASSCGPSQMS